MLFFKKFQTFYRNRHANRINPIMTELYTDDNLLIV